MGKVSPKKEAERRKKPRTKSSRKSSAAKASLEKQSHKSKENEKDTSLDLCRNCSRVIGANQRALFVEEEIARIFCSEDCITSYFGSDIERLEQEYLSLRSKSDLSPAEREKLNHLRWMTLQEPDEIWREKTLQGDFRYTLISEFEPEGRPVWCVCICLFLRGEPSFLYLAFPTRNVQMVNHYRRGERMQWTQIEKDGKHSVESNQQTDPGQFDGLANEWTEEETFRANMLKGRKQDDIPAEEFSSFENMMEPTLEEPDEVWVYQQEEGDEDSPLIYHFIRHVPGDTESAAWYVIVARQTEDEEQIELVEAFPTRDEELVECYRRGTQQVGSRSESAAASRVVH